MEREQLPRDQLGSCHTPSRWDSLEPDPSLGLRMEQGACQSCWRNWRHEVDCQLHRSGAPAFDPWTPVPAEGGGSSSPSSVSSCLRGWERSEVSRSRHRPGKVPQPGQQGRCRPPPAQGSATGALVLREQSLQPRLRPAHASQALCLLRPRGPQFTSRPGLAGQAGVGADHSPWATTAPGVSAVVSQDPHRRRALSQALALLSPELQAKPHPSVCMFHWEGRRERETPRNLPCRARDGTKGWHRL